MSAIASLISTPTSFFQDLACLQGNPYNNDWAIEAASPDSVAQTFLSAVSPTFESAVPCHDRTHPNSLFGPADLEVCGTAGLETCATSPGIHQ
jgi:hypothetical protein